ncbi:MAG: hypothetical protein KBC35_02880 [Candidatus Pacebacteria bacterium]|nr:hypothetical protein [Candidatus Paceibacterota bacterium]
MVTTCRTYNCVVLALLLATPLFGEVFAQSEEIQPEAAVDATTTATTSDTVFGDDDSSSADEVWYKSEQIFGQIDVGDFVVGPGRKEIELRPGQTIVEEITVTNRISDGRTFKLEVEDVVGSKDPRRSVELLSGGESPYSIHNYISFPKDSFVLALGERARIPVTITIPPDAEPGGYYGSVLVSTIRTPGSTDEMAPRSPIIARVGSLFFVTVAGDVVRGGETKSIQAITDKWWYEEGPIDLGILYENTGSIHLNPYGELSIKNMFGEEVGFVELDPWFVLPQALRLREVSWDREFLLGRYTVTAKINRGYDDIVDEVATSFWVLPWKIVGGVFFVLFVIIFSLRAFFRTFEFKRKGD